jgi:hypothetical protein
MFRRQTQKRANFDCRKNAPCDWLFRKNPGTLEIGSHVIGSLGKKIREIFETM